MSQLTRNLGLTATVSVIVGGIIGSGIFMKPAFMASQLPNPWIILSVWIVAGCITLFGALCNAEVASMMPVTGGQYVFFEKMYGKKFAFVYGWAAFSVFNTAGNASVSYICASYTEYFFQLPDLSRNIVDKFILHIPFIGKFYPLEDWGLKFYTIIFVAGLTFLNYKSVNLGVGVQKLLTFLKIFAFGLLIGGFLLSNKGSMSHFSVTTFETPNQVSFLSAYMACIVAAFWGYDGWNNIIFIAGEIKEPHRNIPKGLFWGILICIGIYALINFGYFYILPAETVAHTPLVATKAAEVAMGGKAAIFISLLIILSTLGAANANIFATSRITYTMGNENRMFKFFKAGEIHPINKTPGKALIINMVWSSLLIISGSFDMLTDMLIFVSWFFYGASGLGLFILRFKMKDTPRLYKTWGYPVVPAIFVIFVLVMLVQTLITDIFNYTHEKSNVINSVLGLCITLIGLPLFWLSKDKIKN